MFLEKTKELSILVQTTIKMEFLKLMKQLTPNADLNYSSNLQKPLYLGSMESDNWIQDFYLIHEIYEDGSGSSFSVVEYNGYDSDENGEISESENYEDREYHYPERNGFTGWGS